MNEVQLKSGRSVTLKESSKLFPGTYKINDARSKGALRITGKNIEIDLGGAHLCSTTKKQSDFKGIGILIESAKNVVLRNAKVTGYKYNIVVRNSEKVLVTDCDVSGSYMKPIIGVKKYDKRDWLDIFEEKKWRQYGAGIALENSSDCRVQRCESHDAVNALWLINSNGNFVVHNDFSRNTGWGIWMWKSSRNTVLFNNCDWCVRCEDPKRFSAGGDSAGIMLSHNNCHNLIAHNTMRYGGDGFFLAGPNDDNVIAFNDGSHSPHNAFESTGAERNQFIGNIASNSRHGFWIGGSTYNQIIGNIIENVNEWGISVDTGYENVFAGNEIRRALRGIVLMRSQNRGRESRDNRVIGNTFEDCKTGVTLGNSSNALVTGNTFKKCGTALELALGSRDATISLNNFIGCDTLLDLDDTKDVLFSDNFCGVKTREAVLKRVKSYKEAVLEELKVEKLRTKQVKHEAQPVYAAFANRSARKNKGFMWHTDTKKLVGHAETYFAGLRAKKK